jgi:hypothetical protein
MSVPRSLLWFLAGLLLFDLLVNLPGFSPVHPIGTLLAPTIDLLVVAAVLWGAAQAGEGARIPLRVVVCVLLIVLLCLEAATRFGPDIPLRLLGAGSWVRAAAGCILSIAAVAAAAFLAYLGSGLVVRGFSSVMTRSVFLVVVALLAVLQVVTGHRVFGPSEIPRLFREALSAGH